ncbi:MAG: YicC/YloC family endoribonuclease [Eubacteriales bacterium]|nr:YicC/YloC family endoribonuclease [Eubacteriales bacterium]
MIKSMTGFGRCEVCRDSRKFTVELKSVNHRYLDVNIKMPKKLNLFEAQIRSLLKEYISRGKVDVYITCEDMGTGRVGLRYNRELAVRYVEYLRQISEEFGLEEELRPSVIARFPEVFSMDEEQTDEEDTWRMLEEALRGAAEGFVEMRTREGSALQEDLLAKLEEMQGHVAFIRERSPKIVAEYRQRIFERVQELLGDVKADEARLLTEVTVFADKVCVDEEIVRLQSHISAVKKELRKGSGVGRKLDFLAQEMNREANTILSKTTDLAISDRGIELKTLIEKVREQIQNIE